MDNTFIYLIVAVLVSILTFSIYFLIKNKNASKDNQENTLNINKNLTKEPSSNEYKDEIVTINNSTEIETKVAKIKEASHKIEKSKKVVIKKQPEESLPEPISKLNINISSKTEKILIKKLEAFEKNKGFLKKDVNLNNLAKQFDTNTKYLSEIIKSYKNKNFNQYLNELRINYLIEQLNTNDKVLNTKVSYLASDFGFSSHSSFSTLFTQFMGQSPSEYIKQLKDQKKQA